MFSPQKAWQGWSRTPNSGAHKSGVGSGQNSVGDGGGKGKGKGVAYAEAAASPGFGLVKENGGNAQMGSAEPGSALPNVTQKISQMENELFEYQYNMGLLLIEKKEWTLKYEELRENLAVVNEALKREQAAHLIAISEVEKREENLRKALGVEKQCLIDLEKALREIRAENAEIKYSADARLAEANALVTSIEEKSLELDAKLRASDAKLAEVSRKTSEIEWKSQDLEARESAFRRDRLSFVEEQKAHETTLSKQREDLREWEKKLHEGEERLAKRQIILNQREERANENDKSFKLKQKDLEDVQKKIDESNSVLKSKEDDISNRIASLTLKEKEYADMRVSLEMKEKELLLLEEKLNTREKVEIQKLIDEHNAILELKKRDFETEIDEKRKALDDELKNKAVDVEKKEAEINHKEEKLVKREQALEKRLEKFREKELDHEAKLKNLKEREKSVKLEEKNLENEKKEIRADKEELLKLTAEVEKTRAENEEQLCSLINEREQLKVSEEERLEFQRLQAELKQEIEKYMLQKELVLKEAEDLRQQKEVFEREWEVLDEKRAEIEKELKRVSEQKEEFEKHKLFEEERLINEKMAAQEHIKREQEDLKLARESFETHMEHEKSLLAEKAESERKLMLHDYETRKSELEADMQKRLEEMEKPIREKEKSFEEERKRELDNISYLREVARREMEELKFERSKIGKEKLEASANKEHLESQRIEIRKDIEALFDLSSKLKDQREQFIKERERFLSFIENLKGCSNCGETISNFVISDLQPLAEIENAEVLPMPKLTNYAMEGLAAAQGQTSELSPVTDQRTPVSGGTISWLRKCTTKLFKLSPGKATADSTSVRNLAEEEPFSGEQYVEDPSKVLQSSEIEAEHSFAATSDSFDVQIVQSETSIRVTEAGQEPSANNVEDSKGAEIEEVSQPANKSRRGTRGKAKMTRPRSVKAVVEEAKALLGEDLGLNEEEFQNGNAAADSENANNAVGRVKRKRGRPQGSRASASEQGGGESEGRSDSVAGGQHKKRRGDKVPAAELAPGAGRYNLRRTKAKVTAAAPVRATRNRANKEHSDVVGDMEGAVYSSKAAPTSSVGVTSENGGTRHRLVRCTNTVDTAENRALSEEVNGTPERVGDGDEYISESRADDTSQVQDEEEEEEEYEDEEEEEEESLQPGEASIGKRVWKFLTT